MMILLDTHTLLWFIMGDSKLSPKARSLINNPEIQPFLSVASLGEMAIKISMGKLNLNQPLETLISPQLAHNGIELLEIKTPPLLTVSKLPYHHTDPFDRMIIAQALVEQMPIVGRDKAFDAYDVIRLWSI